MEFQEFCKQRERMCSTIKKEECNLFYALKGGCIMCKNDCIDHYDTAEKIVSKWAKEHPAITNADRFKEIFGFEPDKNSCVIKKSKCPEGSEVCHGCYYYGWWLQEYKETERGD